MANLFVRNVLYHIFIFLLVRLWKNKYHTVGKSLERAPLNALKTLEMKSFTNTMYGPRNVRSVFFVCGLYIIPDYWWEHCEHRTILIS